MDDGCSSRVAVGCVLQGVDVLDYHWVRLDELPARAPGEEGDQAHPCNNSRDYEPLLRIIMTSAGCVDFIRGLSGEASSSSETRCDFAKLDIHAYNYSADQIFGVNTSGMGLT
jgi:hypothetical protein